MPFQLPSDELVTVPFCKLGTPSVDFVLPPIIGSDSSLTQTQQFGIPPVQAQDPLFGGLPVLRKETNGVMQFYSNVIYFMNQGGQFTFDAVQSTALGGYEQGAVLWADSIQNFVVSLIANNTFDFVTTPSYIDSVHWQRVGVSNYPDITDTGGLVTITGTGGLNVITNVQAGGALFGSLTVTGASLFCQAASRGGVFINSQSANVAYLGSNSSNTGLFNGILFDDTEFRPRLNQTTLLGAVPATLACKGDIDGALPVLQEFSVVDSGGNAWVLTCESSIGGFPTGQALEINGTCLVYNYGTGGTNSTINLAAAGIVSGGPTTTSEGVISIKQTTKIGTGNLLELWVGPSTPTGLIIAVTAVGPSTASLSFQIKYK